MSCPGGLADAVRGVAFAARALERQLSDATLAQYRVLALVADDPQRASALAERAALTRPTLTGVLDGLDARGWVTRHDVCGDRRGVHLSITPAGRAALDRAEGEAAEALADLLAELPERERPAVVRALTGLWAATESRRSRRAGPVAP